LLLYCVFHRICAHSGRVDGEWSEAHSASPRRAIGAAVYLRHIEDDVRVSFVGVVDNDIILKGTDSVEPCLHLRRQNVAAITLAAAQRGAKVLVFVVTVLTTADAERRYIVNRHIGLRQLVENRHHLQV
jgi:hypothetical protein